MISWHYLFQYIVTDFFFWYRPALPVTYTHLEGFCTCLAMEYICLALTSPGSLLQFSYAFRAAPTASSTSSWEPGKSEDGGGQDPTQRIWEPHTNMNSLEVLHISCPSRLLLLLWSHDSHMHYLIHTQSILPASHYWKSAQYLALVEENGIYHTLHSSIHVSHIIDNKGGLTPNIQRDLLTSSSSGLLQNLINLWEEKKGGERRGEWRSLVIYL